MAAQKDWIFPEGVVNIIFFPQSYFEQIIFYQYPKKQDIMGLNPS